MTVQSVQSRILKSIEDGDPEAAKELLPLVYDELRKLAAAKMAGENPGHTLQATALVHEPYMRLVGEDQKSTWDNRGHFFAAAAEAMRRILERLRDRVINDGLLTPDEIDQFFSDIKSPNFGAATGFHCAAWGRKPASS